MIIIIAIAVGILVFLAIKSVQGVRYSLLEQV